MIWILFLKLVFGFILHAGQPFSCDLCQSPYVCNPLLSKGGSRSKRSRHMPSPRQKLNPATGKLLTLCNACGRSKCLWCGEMSVAD